MGEDKTESIMFRTGSSGNSWESFTEASISQLQSCKFLFYAGSFFMNNVHFFFAGLSVFIKVTAYFLFLVDIVIMAFFWVAGCAGH